jgi:hypothetical protein
MGWLRRIQGEAKAQDIERAVDLVRQAGMGDMQIRTTHWPNRDVLQGDVEDYLLGIAAHYRREGRD